MDKEKLEKLAKSIRYKVKINGGEANADPKALAEILGWNLETVIKNAKEGSVLQSGDRIIEIVKIKKWEMPKWFPKAKLFLIEIDGYKTKANAKTILDLAGLDESEIDKIKEGKEFEHEGRKIKILERKSLEMPWIRTTF